MGKQDSFIEFTYLGKDYKTKHIEDAGKHAQFGDVFILDNIQEGVKNGLVIKTFDKDLTPSDPLG